MADADDKPFLQLCVAKRLLDQALAREVYRRAREEGRSAGAVLIADGLMAAHTVQALEREVERLSAPRIIAGFRIIRKLGEGGMATVFLAEQLSLQREVALKLMAPQIAGSTESAERFLREARLAATVNHPNIVGVIDVGRDEGQLYLAMELVTGGDAAQLAERLGGVLPEVRALEIISDCAEGLGALSDARLVHRDIKPSNIFLTHDGRAKLGDLGLARSEDGADRLTMTGFLVGTPAFMSPEQAGGAESIDVRSDIYALGATLFDLATGRQPYVGNGPIAIAAKVLTEPVPDPQAVNPRLSPATAALIRRALAKRPEDRFQTPAEFATALRDALAMAQGLPTSRPATPGPAGRASAVTLAPVGAGTAARRSLRGSRPRRTTARPLPMIAAGVALLALAGVVWAVSPRGAKPAPASAGAQPAEAPRKPAVVAAIPPPPLAKPEPTPPQVASAQVAAAKPPASAEAAKVPPPAGMRPAWATAAGHDGFGDWAELRIGDATQRLRWMPPATLTVGAMPDEPGYTNVERRAQATITRGFWIADSECTQGLWRAVMDDNPSAHTGDDRLPVEKVSFFDAAAFTKALGRRAGAPRARLPSRDEWEYACRAGTTTWWWCGNDAAALRAVGNFQGLAGADRFEDSAPVASLPANPWGLHDIHGNVAEWCMGRLLERPPVVVDVENDADLIEGNSGVIRGGSYTMEPRLGRSGALPYVSCESRNADIGFRFIIVGDAPVAR